MVEIIDIIDAQKRIQTYIHKTPVLSSSRINKLLDCEIVFKCENFQKVGAFKYRGAINTISQLNSQEMENGVVTHSSGNHAQALSLAAREYEIPAYIVMPNNAPQVKVDAVKEYGGIISFCEPNLIARETTANQIIEKEKAVFIHPYNNYNIIAGQGTCALELFSQVENAIDIVMAPVGGGGLLSGTAIVAKSQFNDINVFGAEPIMADDAYRSFKSGKLLLQTNPQTIADGLLTSLGDKTFEIIKNTVDDILLCSEESIVLAMRMIFQNLKIVVEPSGAVPLACVIDNPNKFKDKSVALIISGGNFDFDSFQW